MPEPVEVALINMPFGPLLSPSIGLGLLKSSLKPVDVTARVLYLNLDFARLVGEPLYSKVSDMSCTIDLLGEWIFSHALFGHQTDDSVKEYVDRFLSRHVDDSPEPAESRYALDGDFISKILSARERVPFFLRDCLDSVLALEPRVVGFTSLFEQQLASLSLARLIKQESPGTFIVFGGPNCESVMGYEMVRQFGFIDAVVSGEADIAFPELVQRVLANRPVSGMQGVFCRARSPFNILNEPLKNTPVINDLDQVPVPDYDDYFEQLGDAGLNLGKRPVLLFETSRGCWWGEKHHCTFCGLNGETMTHRSKSARRALDELTSLTRAYPGHDVNVVDNILDMGYFNDFIPAVAEKKLGVNLFYEVKSNLKKDQLRLLHKAGITSIQPGIESLSDEVLRIMRKGVSALQNIQLLKWCKELGIKVYWNLIMGFPGERPEAYRQMAQVIPLLTHLQPPNGSASIRVDRFSPNFEKSDELGFKDVLPYAAYEFVYPLPSEAISNLAYFFTFDYKEPVDVAAYTKPVSDEVERWKEVSRSSALFWTEAGGSLMVWDSRPIATHSLVLLRGLEKFVYAACDQIRTPEQVLGMCKMESEEPLSLSDVTAALRDIVAKRIMIEQGGRYLSLAIPRAFRDHVG
ncbi:MAG TPA: RiPP maturation radical SAM C-methyltransferase [Blastocatellia bacterium]|nr:RiPP maturation radical SAM C-methyltransferase [Blastocatellia bacterium]